MRDGRILALLPADEARTAYRAGQHLQLPGHALIPGLVNLHTHAAMTLMRGLADDIALMEWLNRHIWPVEKRLASPEFVYDGTLLACAEMLRGGITAFNDMYFFPAAGARAALDAGIRAALGMIVIEFPSPYAADAHDYLAKGLAVRDELKGEPLLSFCFAPHAPYTVACRARSTHRSSTSRSRPTRASRSAASARRCRRCGRRWPQGGPRPAGPAEAEAPAEAVALNRS